MNTLVRLNTTIYSNLIKKEKQLHVSALRPSSGWILGFEGNTLVQRFPNCGPRTTGDPRVLPLWSS
jgi:hypothetical protein